MPKLTKHLAERFQDEIKTTPSLNQNSQTEKGEIIVASHALEASPAL
jgi:hypothetical protein